MLENKQTNQKKEKYWKLYTIHFPGGKRISKARVLRRAKDSYVIVVTDLHKKKGEAIAECELEDRSYGFVFVTRHDHYGHLDLCHWIRKRGIGGDYLDYLNAVKDGWKEEDWDEEDVEEIKCGAEISFRLEETNASPNDWEITMTLDDEGEVTVYTL